MILMNMMLKRQRSKSWNQKKDVKLYLAGPEVFRPDAREHADIQCELCRKYGFIGLHPMDNNVDIANSSYETAVKRYRGDVNQVRVCDIVVANCNSFRGLLIDDGTAYELGFSNALGKPSYGYIKDSRSYRTRAIAEGLNVRLPSGNYADRNGYVYVDDFGTLINLMMQCGMTEHGGRLVVGSFEYCLAAIRQDLDSGALVLQKRKERKNS